MCAALGVLYAWIMYRQPVNLGETYRRILFAMRAVVVFVTAMLLVSPMLQSNSYKPEKPLILVAQDNSESIKLFPDKRFTGINIEDNLGKLQGLLGDGYDVREFHFSKDLADGLSKVYNGKQTDMAAALRQLNDRYVNQNIGAVVIASDGSYNQGADPQYEARKFKSNIYTIALGDTVPKRDLLIGNVNYNKTAFLGNDFEIEVVAEAYQSKGEQMRLTVSEDGSPVHAETIPVNADAFKKVVTVKVNADKKGQHKFNISIVPVKNELSVQNNAQTIYVDVLDVKQKILMLYDGPHPDITVIKQAIEGNKNYEVKLSLVSDMNGLKLSDYSLIILYQPSGNSLGLLRNVIKGKTPIWYISGAQADLSGLNFQQKLVKIGASNQQMQEVFAQPQPAFTPFTLTDSTLRKIAMFPPLLAPFGNYGASVAPSGILFRQKIGQVQTTYPLLAFGDDNGKRTGILLGEGVWRWGLSEFENYGNHHAVEELFSQSVQYLTANANGQHFRVYPSKNVFDEGESVLLNAELYNDAFEPVNTPDVKIELKNAGGKKFNFLFNKNGSGYQLNASGLPVGEYAYNAGTILGNHPYNVTGQLTVAPLNLELRQSAANHGLLRNVARESGGAMLLPTEIDKLADLIKKNENIKTLVYEDRHYSDIIDVKWIFVLIMLLLGTEWFLRKREGEI